MGCELKIINKVFSSIEEIQVLDEFTEDDEKYFGEILLDAKPKEALKINVHVPKSYPLSDSEISIKFYVDESIVAAHINLDSSLCLHTPSHYDIETRLKWELETLRSWRDKYYVGNAVDAHYDYLLTPYLNKEGCYLFTEIDHQFKKYEFGEFSYSVFSNDGIVGEQAYITEIGNHPCGWSSSIINTKPSGSGYYTFIQDEPLKRPFRIATDWVELEQYLSDLFLKFLYDKKSKNKDSIILILVGYYLPNTTDVHWQLIKVKAKEIPIKGEKIAPKTYKSKCFKKEICWAKTVNSSYDRFFGRGRLSNGIVNKKILIIGTGAIGSGLAHILTRGGVKFLDFFDGDVVEPGNICRSNFYLVDNQLPKFYALKRHLDLISPFIEIKVCDKIPKMQEGEIFLASKARLSKYDLIFDCTSDNELSYLLDSMNLSNVVMNISISNESREMVLVTGGNITSQKSQIFSKFNTEKDEMFYEGNGCWSPTFRASYFDIQGPLNLLVQNINLHFKSHGQPRTMIVKREIIDNKVTLKTIDY